MPAYAAGAANAMPRTKIPLESAQANPLFFLRQKWEKMCIAKILHIGMSCPRNTSATKLFDYSLRPHTIAALRDRCDSGAIKIEMNILASAVLKVLRRLSEAHYETFPPD
jgi:hypothetical protein